MATAFVNYFARLDRLGAQAFQGRSSQAHRADAAVPANVAGAVAGPIVALAGSTRYVEIKATSGNVFACVLKPGATADDLNAAKIRIDAGERLTLSRGILEFAAANLYIWAV